MIKVYPRQNTFLVPQNRSLLTIENKKHNSHMSNRQKKMHLLAKTLLTPKRSHGVTCNSISEFDQRAILIILVVAPAVFTVGGGTFLAIEKIRVDRELRAIKKEFNKKD